ncbi:hypothetical protein [Paenibacillus sp. FSL W7-1287]|uniref:hypothetical protein n=1 Tax=Paenibacillus sp. FSL W7-1287 TaxID=2954538 RepID=UPI0030F68D90
MNIRKKYTLYYIIIVVVIILLGYIYLMKQINCPEALVKKTIEQFIKGNINDLSISENDKKTLSTFLIKGMRLDNINTSIRLINKTNKVSEFLVNFEEINYTDNNELSNVTYGYLLIDVDHSSLFNCNIVNIEIIKKMDDILLK